MRIWFDFVLYSSFCELVQILTYTLPWMSQSSPTSIRVFGICRRRFAEVSRLPGNAYPSVPAEAWGEVEGYFPPRQLCEHMKQTAHACNMQTPLPGAV